MKRYEVQIAPINSGKWETIQRTDDRERAARTTNFWDERMDARMIDHAMLTILEQAMIKYDAAVAALVRSRERGRHRV